MANLRVWHSSRDAYHCAFRLIRLVIANGAPLELERARILDMFLLYPPLLHRTSMPQEVKAAFRALDIPRPEKIFIRLPSPAAVFQDLRLYQNSAVAQLAARGLASPLQMQQGLLAIDLSLLPEQLKDRALERNSTDGGITNFLVKSFSTLPLRGANSVYRKAGLPTRAIAA
ncbi:ABC-three component system middle component 5 [Caulobacter sp. UNC279MFTsu5.1]|uniref:ABC-three component system middle component 5 n=1 Tax=Caulobacter sp. UNC279MFTsu5.1 TaxID=1502775 RepID=UPI00036A65BE|nr:ABC-three component system middle component 5 [Caulobacter sp. UNC279MFTsu5.1]